MTLWYKICNLTNILSTWCAITAGGVLGIALGLKLAGMIW
jgi:hypothetical protein